MHRGLLIKSKSFGRKKKKKEGDGRGGRRRGRKKVGKNTKVFSKCEKLELDVYSSPRPSPRPQRHKENFPLSRSSVFLFYSFIGDEQPRMGLEVGVSPCVYARGALMSILNFANSIFCIESSYYKLVCAKVYLRKRILNVYIYTLPLFYANRCFKNRKINVLSPEEERGGGRDAGQRTKRERTLFESI